VNRNTWKSAAAASTTISTRMAMSVPRRTLASYREARTR
jgi:hypothetical protein